MSLLMDIQTNRCWARVDFLATGEIVLHIPEECELPIRVLVSRGGRSTEYEPNSSEKPNNCEHITEDGVTCAKYPACDDCLDNPLNKVKGSERLVKSSEQTEPQTIRCPKCGRTDYIRDMEKDMGIKGSHYKYKCINCNTYIKTEPTISKMEQVDKDINVRSKDEPQTDCAWR